MKHNHITIHDTTWDGIKHDDRPRLPPTSHRSPHHRPVWQSMQLDGACDSPTGAGGYYSARNMAFAPSRSPALNRRVRAATAAHLQGQNMQLDPAYEQWLKEARERGATAHPGELSPLFPPASASPFSSHRSQARSLAPTLGSEYLPPSSYFPYPRGNYDGRDYWTHTVPDMFRYGAGAPRPPSSTFPYVIESARRMMAAPAPSTQSAVPGGGRPGWTLAGGAPPESRRSRRR